MKLGYSMPLYSIIPALVALLMFVASIWIFDLLRYVSCGPWEPLHASPERVTDLIGSVGKRLYVKTLNQEFYCYETGVWKICKLPADITQSKDFSGSVQPFFKIEDEPVGLVSLTRQDDFGINHYFALMENGDVWECSLDIETELTRILSSGAIVWLLIPMLIGIFSIIVFFRVFADEGQVVFWDFFGRGKRY